MLNPKKMTEIHTTLFPLEDNNEPWLHNEKCFKRHFLSFPQFPFRTLHPRNVNTYFPNDQTFNSSSPIFPANTQINIIFKRRQKKSLINYLLPTNLNYLYGSQKSTLDADERETALSFSLYEPAPAPAPAPAADDDDDIVAPAPAPAADDVLVDWDIIDVEINIKDLYLQVYTYVRVIFPKILILFNMFRLFAYVLKAYIQNDL
jgi:hypothetical protein